jgi:hypothetical protein
MGKTPSLSRARILAYRRHIGSLDSRPSGSAASLRAAAWAGLQDSMPRAALLSLHARLGSFPRRTGLDTGFIQVWGPRFSAYTIAAADRAVFTLGRMPREVRGQARAEQLADRIHAFLRGRRVAFGDVARGIGERSPNMLRYAAPTGRVLMSWDGARQPQIWAVPAPRESPEDMRLELARRYLRVFGPATPGSFALWAGVPDSAGKAVFEELAASLARVRTPIGEAWMMEEDLHVLQAPRPAPAPTTVRLLPSGDAYYLLQGDDRRLLLPRAEHRRALWTSRVWPGAILAGGEIIGTWRRAHRDVRLQPWGRVNRALRKAIEDEAASLPIPGVAGGVAVTWED